MKISVKSKGFKLTPSLKNFIGGKLGSILRLVERFDLEGAVELRLEVEKTTAHHRKGDVFSAAADLRLPGRIIRAEKSSGDLRVAVDLLRHTLRLEIEKYRTRKLAKGVK